MVGTTVPMLAPMVEAEHYCTRFGTRLTVRYRWRASAPPFTAVVKARAGRPTRLPPLHTL